MAQNVACPLPSAQLHLAFKLEGHAALQVLQVGCIAIPVPQPFFAFEPVQVTFALAWCIASIMAAPPCHDDPAYFQKRCEDIFLPSRLLNTLVDKGFNSMALLALPCPLLSTLSCPLWVL